MHGTTMKIMLIEFLVLFLSPFRRMPEWYLNLGHDRQFTFRWLSVILSVPLLKPLIMKMHTDVSTCLFHDFIHIQRLKLSPLVWLYVSAIMAVLRLW